METIGIPVRIADIRRITMFPSQFNLETAIDNFQQKGLCVVPRGKYREEFETHLESLGLGSVRKIDTHWECWIFEKLED
jgi:hypothetical protein